MNDAPGEPASAVSRHVLRVLDPLLGRFTARRAVELVAQQCGTTLDMLAPSELELLCERLRPMLRTLLGSSATADVLKAIADPYREARGAR